MKKVMVFFLIPVSFVMLSLLGGCTEDTTTISTEPPTTTLTTTTLTGSFSRPFVVSVSNGAEAVTPCLVFLCSYECILGTGCIFADGPGMFGYDPTDHTDDFPVLDAGSLRIDVESDATVGDIRFYDEEGLELPGVLLSGVSELDPGTYYLRFTVGKSQGEFYADYFGFVKILVP